MQADKKTVAIADIKPYPNNPRINDTAVDAVAESIRQCGYISPIVVDENMVILAGHTRHKALQKLGWKDAPVLVMTGMTEEQKRKYRLLDNKTNELAEWDIGRLEIELEGLDFDGFDFGWDELANDFADDTEEEDAEEENKYNPSGVSLQERFVAPPFSVLDTRQGYWQNRKKAWKELGIESENGRSENLTYAPDLPSYMKAGNKGMAVQTSIFDPVVCEIAYRWFCPVGGKIFDCFAGGSVRGVVADSLGYQYTGIELRQEQVDANRNNAAQIGAFPVWICDDSRNADDHIEDESVDMVFSCPPYADLEVYSDDPRDISNMDYDDFSAAYREIISAACRKLKKDRFAVFVVGDVRDKRGFYRNFVDLTKKCFNDCGCLTYNELILIEQPGTAALRAGGAFKNRKVIKKHQNVLVFYKGDPKKIQQNYGVVEVAAIDAEGDM